MSWLVRWAASSNIYELGGRHLKTAVLDDIIRSKEPSAGQTDHATLLILVAFREEIERQERRN